VNSPSNGYTRKECRIMSEHTTATNGVTTSVPHYTIEDQVTVCDAILNGLMAGTLKADAAKAALAVIRHPLEVVKVGLAVHKSGFKLSPKLAASFGMNGVAALENGKAEQTSTPG
jgi:hypothetical protein